MSESTTGAASKIEGVFDKNQHVLADYENKINYYWGASRSNKHWYKVTSGMTVVLGALVTLVASLSSSTMLPDEGIVKAMFAVGTPVLAAMLTILAGFSQSFHWGSTWQNMVLTAQQLEKSRGEFLLTPVDQRDHLAELQKLNGYVIGETESFFERMLGGRLKRMGSSVKGAISDEKPGS